MLVGYMQAPGGKGGWGAYLAQGADGHSALDTVSKISACLDQELSNGFPVLDQGGACNLGELPNGSQDSSHHRPIAPLGACTLHTHHVLCVCVCVCGGGCFCEMPRLPSDTLKALACCKQLLGTCILG